MGDESMKMATIELANGSQVEIQLFAAAAPGTVDNFTKLANEGFYDGTNFHRVIPGFVAQGGCPKGNGTGGPGYSIKCEINENKHLRGSLAMAHRGPNTGGSQFYICYGPQPHLDSVHTVFGQVIAGMENMDKVKQGDKVVSIQVTETDD